jgi:hypothetical protein
MRGPWVSNTQRPRIDREEMIKMAALGLLLLMIVVVTTIAYIAGLAWLARHELRRDETPPQHQPSTSLR